MSLKDLVSGFLASALLLVMCGNAHGRCAPSAAYQTSIEVVSCGDRDPDDHSKPIGFGVILVVKVASKTRIGNPGDHDWWPAKDPLPEKMKVFHDTAGEASCASLKPGARRTGTMRSLCCDGGEPRCHFGTSVGLYEVKK